MNRREGGVAGGGALSTSTSRQGYPPVVSVVARTIDRPHLAAHPQHQQHQAQARGQPAWHTRHQGLVGGRAQGQRPETQGLNLRTRLTKLVALSPTCQATLT